MCVHIFFIDSMQHKPRISWSISCRANVVHGHNFKGSSGRNENLNWRLSSSSPEKGTKIDSSKHLVQLQSIFCTFNVWINKARRINSFNLQSWTLIKQTGISHELSIDLTLFSFPVKEICLQHSWDQLPNLNLKKNGWLKFSDRIKMQYIPCIYVW